MKLVNKSLLKIPQIYIYIYYGVQNISPMTSDVVSTWTSEMLAGQYAEYGLDLIQAVKQLSD